MIISDYPISTLITLATTTFEDEFDDLPEIIDSARTILAMQDAASSFVHIILTGNTLLFVAEPFGIEQVEDFVNKDATFVETIGTLNLFKLNGITFVVKLEE